MIKCLIPALTISICERFWHFTTETVFIFVAKLNQIRLFCGQNAVNFLERYSMEVSGFKPRYWRERADTPPQYTSIYEV
jgi:hypothetical protein